MDISIELNEWLDAEGGFGDGSGMDDEEVEIHTIENIEKEKIVSLHKELLKIKKAIADTFEDKQKMLDLIEMKAKLRLLIQKRLKGIKKIPQEYVDKYNDTVESILQIIEEQASKET